MSRTRSKTQREPRTIKCPMCGGRAERCAVCRQTGVAPTTADLRMGGPYVAYALTTHLPYVVHFGGGAR